MAFIAELILAVLLVLSFSMLLLMIGYYPILALMVGYHVGVALLIYWYMYFIGIVGSLVCLKIATAFGLLIMVLCLALHIFMRTRR